MSSRPVAGTGISSSRLTMFGVPARAAAGIGLLTILACSRPDRPFSERRPTFAPGTGLVAGIVSSPGRPRLSPEAVLRLSLVRLAAGDRESVVATSSQRLGSAGLPVRFWLEFPWRSIDSDAAYALRGEIRDSRHPELRSRVTQRVLTGGYPPILELVVEPEEPEQP